MIHLSLRLSPFRLFQKVEVDLASAFISPGLDALVLFKFPVALVDKSVVEVFVNGKQCVAVRVYPERSDSVGVSLRAQGKYAHLKKLDAWQMQNICL